MNKLAELEYDDRGIADLKIGDTGWTIRVVKRERKIATYFMHDTCDSGNGWAFGSSRSGLRACYKCEEDVPKQAIVFNKFFKLRI